jgi:hypothetical protein
MEYEKRYCKSGNEIPNLFAETSDAQQRPAMLTSQVAFQSFGNGHALACEGKSEKCIA